jgi:hypothetical protein
MLTCVSGYFHGRTEEVHTCEDGVDGEAGILEGYLS